MSHVSSIATPLMPSYNWQWFRSRYAEAWQINSTGTRQCSWPKVVLRTKVQVLQNYRWICVPHFVRFDNLRMANNAVILMHAIVGAEVVNSLGEFAWFLLVQYYIVPEANYQNYLVGSAPINVPTILIRWMKVCSHLSTVSVDWKEHRHGLKTVMMLQIFHHVRVREARLFTLPILEKPSQSQW